jgi:hypothetical protein
MVNPIRAYNKRLRDMYRRFMIDERDYISKEETRIFELNDRIRKQKVRIETLESLPQTDKTVADITRTHRVMDRLCIEVDGEQDKIIMHKRHMTEYKAKLKQLDETAD